MGVSFYGGGGGGTVGAPGGGATTYGALSGKPKINGITIEGDHTPDYYGIKECNCTGGGTMSGDDLLNEAVTATVNVGGVKAGQTFAKDTPLENVLKALITPVTPPTIGNPTATLNHTTGAKRYVYGYDETIGSHGFSITFNRGTISSGGNTVGAATGYNIAGTVGTSNSATINIDALMGSNPSYTVTGSVSHGAGDQPKNSDGTNYGSPRAANVLAATPNFVFEKRRYVYATIDNDGVLKRLDIQQKSASPVEVDLKHPYPNAAKVSLPRKATKIEYFNTLNNTFTEIAREFTETQESIDGITYYTYTDNRDYSAGNRTLRFTF